MRRAAALGLVFVLFSALAFAGDNPYAGKIANYVWVEQVQINSGKWQVHQDLARQYRQAATSLNTDAFWLAASPITGEGNQTMFVSFHDNYAGIEQAMETFNKVGKEISIRNANFAAQTAESERGGRSMISKFRPDLSYRPDQVDVAQATRWRISTYRLKPGTGTAFADLVKEVMELEKKADANAHWIAYQVVSGGPGPQFVFVSPLKALADLDQDDSMRVKEVFTPTIQRQLDAQVKDMVLYTETTFYAVRPDLSRPSPNIIAANPEFWTVKDEAPVVASTTGKKTKRAAQPASMKQENKN